MVLLHRLSLLEGDGHTVNDGRRRHQFLNSRSVALHAGISVRMARIAWAVERNRALPLDRT